MNIALILSGGTGSRMGLNVPKQYLKFNGKPIMSYSLEAFDCNSLVDGIVIVAEKQWRNEIDKWLKEYDIKKFLCYADPGETRQYSIISGLKEIERLGGADKVIIHDAARPLVSEKLITSCIEGLEDCDGVMPVLPAKDTFYILDNNNMVSKLLPRSLLAAGQAPEAFDYRKYHTANMSLSRKELLEINGSSELAVKCGMKIKTIAGDERNIKVTTPNDLLLLEAYMKEEK